MKHYSTILVLAFLLLAFPTSFKSQTHKSSAKTQKVKQNSDEVQAKEIVKQLIDGFFIKRKFLPILQNLFSFAPCDKIDKEFLDQNCTIEKVYPVKINSALGLRVVSIGIKHQFLPFYLILGTTPIIKDSDESYPYYSSEFEELESRILKKNNYSIHEIDFKNLGKKEFQQKITQMEKVNNEMEEIIFNQINLTIYNENINIMKKTLTVEKKVENGRKYYIADMQGLVYWFILTKRNGQLKIVGIGDSI